MSTDNILANPKQLDSIYIYNLKKYLSDKNISNNYFKKIDHFILCLSESKFIILKILRVLPGRRIVFLAKYNASSVGRYFVIKLYINQEKYTKDYEQYIKGYCLLTDNNLDTPEIVYSRLDDENKLAYIITNYIKHDDITGNKLDLEHNYKLYIEAIARLHYYKVYQQDLHFDNFIISENKVYYLDCDSLEQHDSFIVNKKSLGNFALFLVQLDIEYSTKRHEYINYYLECLNNSKDVNIHDRTSIINYILSSARLQLNLNIKKFINKTNRSCTKFIKNSNFISDTNTKVNYIINREKYNSKKALFSDFLNNPEQFIQQYSIKTLKSGNTAKLYLINYNNYQFVVKHYLTKSVLKQFISTLKSYFVLPRSLNSWVYANLLISFNILTPNPLASVIYRKNKLIKDSYFLMEYIEYNNLAELILNNQVDTAFHTKIKTDTTNLFNKFKLLSLAHSDFKAANLGYINNKLLVLDLDSMSRISSWLFFKRLHNKDKIRLDKCLSLINIK